MKKLISTIIVLTLAFTMVMPVLAEDTKTVSLQDAINTAVTNSSSLQLLQDKIKLSERKYNTALKNADGASSKYWHNVSERMTNAETEFITPLQKKSDLYELKWQLDNAKSLIMLDVTTLYYEILFKQQQISTQQQTLIRVKNEYEAKKKQVKAGTLSNSSLLSYEIAVEQAQNALESLQNSLSGLYIDLNQKLSYSLNQKLNLKNEVLALKEFNIADMDKLVSDVVAASHTVNKLLNDKAIKEKERWVYYGYWIGETPDEFDTLNEDISNMDYSIRDEKLEVEYKVRSDYNNLLNLFDDITIKKVSYDQAVKLLDLSKVRYGLGLVTMLDYQKAQGDRDAALEEYNMAQLNYYLAGEQFKNYIYPVTISK